MIYGYVTLYKHQDNWYEEEQTDVKKVRLFNDKKERDNAKRIEFRNGHWTETFETKSEQGKLILIEKKEYNALKKEIEALKNKLTRYDEVTY